MAVVVDLMGVCVVQIVTAKCRSLCARVYIGDRHHFSRRTKEPARHLRNLTLICSTRRRSGKLIADGPACPDASFWIQPFLPLAITASCRGPGCTRYRRIGLDYLTAST
jgi:hypothetical protein